MSPRTNSTVMPQTATLIIARTATAFRLEPDDITGPSRLRPNVRARQAAAWVLRHSPHFIDHSQEGAPIPVRRSLPRIAGLLGRSDHSTISYHLAQAEHRRDKDPDWRALLDGLLGGALPAKINFIPPPPKLARPPRQIRHRNDFKLQPDDDPHLADTDAAKRQHGTLALAAALAAYQQERAA